MPPVWTADFSWWITVVELPAIGTLFWLIWRNRQDIDRDLGRLRRDLDGAVAALHAESARVQLDVAKNYVSVPYLKDVERRLTQHLVRIEGKLDSVQSREGGSA
ncbi:MAG: hypothetical protein AB7G39_12660 [Alphaproteobacteria bacterium]